MEKGRPGNDPILDITVHQVGVVYTAEIDSLIREVWSQCGTSEQAELRALLPNPGHPGAAELEEVHLELEAMRSRLLGEARDRGWEGPPEPDGAQLEDTPDV